MKHQGYTPVFGPGISPRLRRDQILRGILKKLNLVLVGVLVLQVLFHFFLSPHLLVRKVEVKGYLGNSEEILALTGLTEGAHFFSVDEATVADRILSRPNVRSARVRKVFPDSLEIVIEMRQPVALLLRSDTKDAFVVDAEGVIFPKPLTRGMDFPLVSGFGWNAEAGLPVLPEPYLGFLRDLSLLRAREPVIYESLSEIRVHSHAQSGFSLALSFVHSPIELVVGSNLKTDVLQQGLLFLDLMGRRAWDGKVSELDMRKGLAVFRENTGRSDG